MRGRWRARKCDKELEGILDLERLTSRVTLGVVTPRDLLALRGSLEKIPRVRALRCGCDERADRNPALASARGDPSKWMRWRMCAI